MRPLCRDCPGPPATFPLHAMMRLIRPIQHKALAHLVRAGGVLLVVGALAVLRPARRAS